MTKNLTASLILYEKMITSEAKAKMIKGEIEKILTIGKQGDLHARRLLISRLNSKPAVRKVFEDLNIQFKNKKSGFTRIVKIDHRQGDNSPQVMIELLIKHKEEERQTKRSAEVKTKDKTKIPEKRKQDKRGFWDRLRGQGSQIKEVAGKSKKTIERTTSK